MNSKNKGLAITLPVFMSFFVMSFVDLVGIGVDRASADFNLSATLAQLIPSAAFLWFFVLSVPVGILQDRLGKKKTLNAGMIITALGLIIPFTVYTFGTLLAGFALLGIGNTIVQVSANPLLVDVAPDNRASSYLSFSQFVKSVGSMLGAPLAAFFAAQLNDWKVLFIVFGVVSVISVAWLASVSIEERKIESQQATMGSAFKLLGNQYILLMVLSIFLVVGIDVGMNSNSGQFLMGQLGMDKVLAESGRSVYFFGRMLGTFGGALLLTRLSSRKFLLWSAVLSIISILAFIYNPSQEVAWGLIFIIGLGVANIFPLVFSITVERYPERANEISGLMMMAVSGGAVIPPLMGWLTDSIDVAASMYVLVACAVFIMFASLYAIKKK
ncbi:MFS transporter [Puteibacter caeruleilacunae]|nr:MFS transporter [Puteibacter caeruleilacunae]